MSVQVVKNTKESFERFLSRFDGLVQRARIVRLRRERKHHVRKPNRRQVRDAAIKRDYYRKRRERMRFY